MRKLLEVFKQLGPGLMYAGAAVGVSHLVQSTRAGAEFGYSLLWVIPLAHIIKYPFFKMGPIFAATTGQSILSGYKQIGRWALWLFIAITVLSMFGVIAAISAVTAGIAESIFSVNLSIKSWTSLILGICLIILAFGNYKSLDKLIKWVILLLSITTIIAFLNSLGIEQNASKNAVTFDWNNQLNLMFLIAFIGWMPAPLDISVWHSVWQVEKQQQTKMSLNDVNRDFNIGYIGTAILAVFFVSLGAQTFYGSGIELAAGGVKFSEQLISIYASLIGNWAYWVIALAALITMFSTIITCLDAFPRTLNQALISLKLSFNNGYLWLLIGLIVGAQIMVYFYLNNMKQIVDFATTVSFLTTPIIAALNLLAYRKIEPTKSKYYQLWSVLSLVVLTAFALYYLLAILPGNNL